MLFLTIFSVLVICAHGSLLFNFPTFEGKIVGGSPAHITEVPYQVALLQNYNGHFLHVCGGSIISSTAILTAAHCTNGTNALQWRVRAGSTYHTSGGQLVSVSEIIQHSGFNDILDHDISIIHLSTPLVLGKVAAAITLPYQGQTVLDGAPALVTGWGTLTEGGSSPTHLYKVTLPILNQEICEQAYVGYYAVTQNMICAGLLGIGGQDACQGDSGGPLAIDNVLIGISSWGNGCAQPFFPGVWTRVAMYRNWVNSNM